MTLSAHQITCGYGRNPVLRDLSFSLPPGRMTAIVGANGCGKSTLLKALSGSLRCQRGQLRLHERDLTHWPPRERARLLARLPQAPPVPAAMSVRELVSQGRHPHLSWLSGPGLADRQAVDQAIDQCQLRPLTERAVASLSGGERQRAWIAMTIAQQAPILLLDEPTTALDINHQLEVLALLRRLQRERDLTVCMVMHDLNHCLRCCDHIVAMQAGRIIHDAATAATDMPALVQRVFGLRAEALTSAATGDPLLDFHLHPDSPLQPPGAPS